MANKNLLNEINKMRSMMNLNEVDRVGMNEFLGTETNNVDTLLQLMSKYTPKDGWLVSVGYLNIVKINKGGLASQDIEDYGREMGDDYVNSILDTPEFQAGKETGKFQHPHAGYKPRGGEEVPNTMYKLKMFSCQWLSPEGRKKLKGEKDSQLAAAFQSKGVEPLEIDPEDQRGLGWNNLQGTPFDQHQETGTKRFVMFRKTNCYMDSKPIYYAKINGEITQLTQNQKDFLFKIDSTSRTSSMPKKYQEIEDEALRNELWNIDKLYEYKNLDLEKIPFISCTCVVDGENKKFSYVNKNVVVTGTEPGDFAPFISGMVDQTPQA